MFKHPTNPKFKLIPVPELKNKTNFWSWFLKEMCKLKVININLLYLSLAERTKIKRTSIHWCTLFAQHIGILRVLQPT